MIRTGHLGIIRLTGAELRDLRYDRWHLDKGICQRCGAETCYWPRYDGDPRAYDMAHIKSRGAGGSDTLENVETLCHRCHMLSHSGGKPVPAKTAPIMP